MVEGTRQWIGMVQGTRHWIGMVEGTGWVLQFKLTEFFYFLVYSDWLNSTAGKDNSTVGKDSSTVGKDDNRTVGKDNRTVGKDKIRNDIILGKGINKREGGDYN